MKYVFYTILGISLFLNLLFFIIVRKAVNNKKMIEKRAKTKSE